jgi:hypothetical protein
VGFLAENFIFFTGGRLARAVIGSQEGSSTVTSASLCDDETGIPGWGPPEEGVGPDDGFSGLLGASRGFSGLHEASRGFTGLAEVWCRVGSLVGILRRPSGCGKGRELSGWNSPGASGRLADYGAAIP